MIFSSKIRLWGKRLFSSKSVINLKNYCNFNNTRAPRFPSALHLSYQATKELNLSPLNQYMCRFPPWMLKNKSLDISLSYYKKNNTSPDTYRKIYLEKQHQLKRNGFNLLFTDGSKNDNGCTSYAVIGEDLNTIILQILPEVASVFTAEAAAILDAINYGLKKYHKTAIFSDCLSVFQAISTPKTSEWQTINKIRDVLISKRHRILLIWLPGHIGIKGNEAADAAANFANNAPIIMREILEKPDALKLLKHFIINNSKTNSTVKLHHHYKKIISEHKPPQYPDSYSNKKQIITFSRLRLGHTFSTHDHLLKGETPPKCKYCTAKWTLQHILSECKTITKIKHNIFGPNTNIYDILKDTSDINIQLIYKFTKKLNIII